MGYYNECSMDPDTQPFSYEGWSVDERRTPPAVPAAAATTAPQPPTTTTTDSAVAAALERLAEQHAMSARQARERGAKDEATFFQRSANAYTKALGFWLAGLRPTPTPHGYMLPSQRPGEAPHLLTMHGDWVCTCQAGESMHWAKALVVGMEVGYDDLGRLDDDNDEPKEEVDDIPETRGLRRALADAAAVLGFDPGGIDSEPSDPPNPIPGDPAPGCAPGLGRRLAAARARLGGVRRTEGRQLCTRIASTSNRRFWRGGTRTARKRRSAA